jgi:DNA-binding NarL/FixJ family response regulator
MREREGPSVDTLRAARTAAQRRAILEKYGFLPYVEAFPRRLTERQLQVLEMMATRTAKETAAELGVSVQTVKNTLSVVYQRLGATTLQEAFFILGWLKPGPQPMAHEAPTTDAGEFYWTLGKGTG